MFSIVGALPTQLYWVILLCLSLCALSLRKRYGWLAVITMTYLSWSALRICIPLTNPFPDATDVWREALKASSAAALVILLLTIGTVTVTPRWILITGMQCLALLQVGTLIVPPHQGFLLNSSMSGCLQACLLPLFFRADKKWFWLTLISVSVVCSFQTQPVLLLLAMWGVYLWRHADQSRIGLLLFAFPLLPLIFDLDTFFSDSGRLHLWGIAYEFWKTNVNAWCGLGIGTTYPVLPFLSFKAFGQAVLSLHSDWLQLIFETGFIGLALVAVLFFQALWRARHDVLIFTSCLGFGLFALANFPARQPIAALCGAAILRLALARAGKHTLHRSCQE